MYQQQPQQQTQQQASTEAAVNPAGKGRRMHFYLSLLCKISQSLLSNYFCRPRSHCILH
jgi:hypothetical protein